MDTTLTLSRNFDCKVSTAAHDRIMNLTGLSAKGAYHDEYFPYYSPPETGDTRLLGLLDTCVWAVGQHMPKLTEEQWLTLFVMVCRKGSLNPRYVSGMMQAAVATFQYDGDFSREDIDAFAELQPINWLAIALVANRFHGEGWFHTDDLRHTISEYTGEPRECVFLDDPSVEDCWTLASIQSVKGMYVAHWVYVDGTKATLTLDASFTLAGFECETDRHLAPADKTMSCFLFKP
ncbi:hypothetical protein HTT03_00355, partial [Sulfitobacter sp. S0837]